MMNISLMFDQITFIQKSFSTNVTFVGSPLLMNNPNMMSQVLLGPKLLRTLITMINCVFCMLILDVITQSSFSVKTIFTMGTLMFQFTNLVTTCQMFFEFFVPGIRFGTDVTNKIVDFVMFGFDMVIQRSQL